MADNQNQTGNKPEVITTKDGHFVKSFINEKRVLYFLLSLKGNLVSLTGRKKWEELVANKNEAKILEDENLLKVVAIAAKAIFLHEGRINSFKFKKNGHSQNNNHQQKTTEKKTPVAQ